MIAQIIGIINLIIPTGWELVNDRNGDKDKTRDIFVRYALMVSSAVVNFFWVTGKSVFDSVFLSAGIHFMIFDYAIAWWLIMRKTKGKPGIEPPRGVKYHWFTYLLSGSPFDNLWYKWNPWVRFGIRVIVLGAAIAIYIIKN